MPRIEPGLVPVVTDLERGLRELGIPFGVVGALVPELRLDARPARMTNDADVTVVVQSLADFEALKNRLAEFGFTRTHRVGHFARPYARATSITVDDECLHGHFSSKDDLIAQASARELARSLAHWSKVGDRASGDRLSAIAALYLTSTHRDNPGAGCVLAALGPDVSRQVRPCGTPSPTMCVPFAIFWPSWFRDIENGEAQEGHQHVRNIGRRNGSRARDR